MKLVVKYGLYILVFFLVLGASAYLTTRLIVKGEPEVVVPDLSGQDTISALEVLAGLGLNLKVHGFGYSDQVAKDRIVSQDPESGMRVKKGRVIKVVISKGSRKIALPDLKGLSLDQARSILSQSELKVGLVSYTYSQGAEQERDRILAQIPAPMTETGHDVPVDLLVSLGPRPVEIVMPDMTAQNYSQALLELERAGLKPGPLEYETRANWPAGAVVFQNPLPGGKVRQGDVVILTINREKVGESVEYSFRLLDYEIDYGLFQREIRFQAPYGPFQIDLYQQWHGPGETVRVLALIPDSTRVSVYEDERKRALIDF